mmetsp:Transcript_11889/g.24431  ORF Transcript_11889/g.24431 Transcript_11889/m.24431 type:complete len:263 (+) Transcript_11889:787-1575(+)
MTTKNSCKLGLIGACFLPSCTIYRNMQCSLWTCGTWVHHHTRFSNPTSIPHYLPNSNSARHINHGALPRLGCGPPSLVDGGALRLFGVAATAERRSSAARRMRLLWRRRRWTTLSSTTLEIRPERLDSVDEVSSVTRRMETAEDSWGMRVYVLVWGDGTTLLVLTRRVVATHREGLRTEFCGEAATEEGGTVAAAVACCSGCGASKKGTAVGGSTLTDAPRLLDPRRRTRGKVRGGGEVSFVVVKSTVINSATFSCRRCNST